MVNTCLTNLRYFRENPLSLLTVKKDVFDRELEVDDGVLQALCQPLSSLYAEEQFKKISCSLVDGIIGVLERQLERYIGGDLSNPSPALLEQTKSAPTHNMFAECIMGLTDHHFKRALNATTGFIDRKVKSAKNNTMSWLASKTSTQQKSIIYFGITRARQMRNLWKKRAENIAKIQDHRVSNKLQKFDKSARMKIERNLKDIYEKGATVADKLSSFDSETQQFITTVISDLAVLTDVFIDHIWYDSDDGQKHLYHGKVIWALSRAKIPNLKVAYWSPEETVEDAVDYKFTVVQFLADYLSGDLTLNDM
ncbi:uncharacterized protein LOC126821183 isoform X2 [Patella vulgata]|uniref:uncharacterized protein LOC126821183 isoform X2 n=1 Tax=Patella vulgata TaxID=6465 RepID=UPI00217FD467|nr:uncharacterized protein LOC126821183 isoform X2 [Patella vulgata]